MRLGNVSWTLALLLLGLAAPVPAWDEVELHDGRVLRGSVSEDGGWLVVRRPLGEVRVDPLDVVRIDRGHDPLDELERRRAAARRAGVGPDALAARLALAEHARTLGSAADARAAFLDVLRLEPAHAGARAALAELAQEEDARQALAAAQAARLERVAAERRERQALAAEQAALARAERAARARAEAEARAAGRLAAAREAEARAAEAQLAAARRQADLQARWGAQGAWAGGAPVAVVAGRGRLVLGFQGPGRAIGRPAPVVCWPQPRVRRVVHGAPCPPAVRGGRGSAMLNRGPGRVVVQHGLHAPRRFDAGRRSR